MRIHRNKTHRKSNTRPFVAPSPIIKKTLAIGAANDIYELEADAIADKVVAISDTSVASMTQIGPLVQGKCASCEQEEHIQMKPLVEQISPLIQKSSIPKTDPSIASDNITVQINNNKGDGSLMANDTRSYMESRFGTDFSGVRIHTDSNAIQLSRQLNAQAFTVGNDVYFNEGKYNPASNTGKHLLAHELTHTIQQGGIRRKIQRFVNCGSSSECPTRASGEIGRSRRDPMALNRMTSGEIGMLISNFAVNNGNIRGDLTTNTSWNDFIRYMETNPNTTWEILGFSDCQGEESLNTNLRTLRATDLYFALPDSIKPRINQYGASSPANCIRNNGSESNRRINRSAMIRLISTSYEMEPETVPGSITTMNCDDGRIVTADPDHDLDKIPHSGDRSPAIVLYDHIVREPGVLDDFRIGFFTGTSGESTSDDNRLYNHFVTGSGSRITFSPTSDMSRIIKGTNAFSDFVIRFERSIKRHFRTRGTLRGFHCRRTLNRTRPGYIGKWDSIFSVAVMGGYQWLTVRIEIRAGRLSTYYRIYDHYGAGVSDAWSEFPGLSALYYLQHYVPSPMGSNTYNPYIWSVKINRTTSL